MPNVYRRMNPGDASTSTPNRKTRLKGRKSSGKKSSSLSEKINQLSRIPTVSERLSQETDDKLRLEVAKTSAKKGRPQPRTVFMNLDYCPGSPVRIPNSQAPIEGREVYWDLDTPETKKNRAALEKHLAAIPDSPKARPLRGGTPRLRMVPRPRRRVTPDSTPSSGGLSKGEAALEDLINFVDEMNEEESRNEKNKSESPRTDDSPSTRDNEGRSDSGDMFDDDDFGSDDEMLLLVTQQPIEESVKKTPLKPTPALSDNRETGSSSSEPSDANTGNKVNNVEDSFGDDSFDEFMSQMEMPGEEAQVFTSAPTLPPQPSTTSAIRSSVQGSSKPRTPNASVRNSSSGIKGFEDEFNDSFDNVLSQIELPSMTMAPPNRNLHTQTHVAGKAPAPFTSTQKPSPLAVKPVPVVQPKPKLTFNFQPKKNMQNSKENQTQQVVKAKGGGGPVRKFSSYNPPPTEKIVIGKFKSDSSITIKPPCSKEEIEKKRKEALARKQKLQSQKQGK